MSNRVSVPSARAEELTSGQSFRRPELRTLSAPEKRRVLAWVQARGEPGTAGRGHDLVVGDALYLGFLFVSAGQDDYMVALSCRDPQCPHPRTGIRLRGAQFLDDAVTPKAWPGSRRRARRGT